MNRLDIQEKGFSLKIVIPVIMGVVMLSVVSQMFKCTAGTTKCEGYNLYQCDGQGNWVLVKENAPECGYVPVSLFGCPYCTDRFDTLSELVAHVASEHPDKPPIQEVDITWD